MKSTALLNEPALGPGTRTTDLAFPVESGLWRSARSLWQRMLRLSRRAPRRLRLCESLPLGERRFVAVVEFEDSRFLVGGTSASLVLLARLENTRNENKDVDEPEVAPPAGAPN
jgi:hypothetical protein